MTPEKKEEPVILLWRGEQEVNPSRALVLPRRECFYCGAPLRVMQIEDRNMRNCPLCGWGYYILEKEVYFDGFLENAYLTCERFLRKFKISSSEIALQELGTHLKRRFSDIYSLESYRFEELIGDIYRQMKFKIEMTKRSVDGGVDLFLLSDGGNRICIVQCKRYKQNRKIGVSVVRELLGTQLQFDVRRAILVTTSTFTTPARKGALKSGVIENKFEVEFVDASDLLKMLKVYNERIPPLHELDGKFVSSRLGRS
jgi:hypothetical protein